MLIHFSSVQLFRDPMDCSPLGSSSRGYSGKNTGVVGFPGGANGKRPACQCGRPEFDPSSGAIAQVVTVQVHVCYNY